MAPQVWILKQRKFNATSGYIGEGKLMSPQGRKNQQRKVNST